MAEEKDDDKAPGFRDEMASLLAEAGKAGEAETETEPEAPEKAAAAEESPADAPASEPADSDGTSEEPAGDTDQSEKKPDSESEEAVETIDAPNHWAQEDREAFGKLSDDAKQLVLAQSKRMEAAHTQRSQELAQQAKSFSKYEQIDRLLEPYRQQLRLAGADEVQFLGSLVAAQQYLQTNPQEGLRWLAQQYGVDFPSTDDDATDPQVSQLYQHVSTLQQQLQAQQQASQQAAVAQKQAEIDAFVNAKDESGKPKHPYWNDLQGEITLLARAELAAGRVPQLSELYERAIWANPDFRQKELDRRDAEARAKREAEEKERLARAKKSGTAVKKSGGGSPTTDEPKSLRDELRSQFDKAASS